MSAGIRAGASNDAYLQVNGVDVFKLQSDGTATQVAAPAWDTSFTPVLSAATGTIANATTSMRYLKVGRKVSFFFQANIIDKGTADGDLRFTLPHVPVSTAILVGRENAVGGKMLQGVITGGLVSVFDYANLTTIFNGAVIYMSGEYEAVA